MMNSNHYSMNEMLLLCSRHCIDVLYKETSISIQIRQKQAVFEWFSEENLTYCTKDSRKKKIVCEHFQNKISIIILVTPPIHYIVFLLHPISNKKIPSPEKDSRSVGCPFRFLGIHFGLGNI